MIRSLASAAAAILFAGCATNPASQSGARDVRAAEDLARRMVQAEASIRADTIPPRSVGVTPLIVSPADSALAPIAFALSDFIMADLAKSSQLVVVNRLRFDAVLRELDLARSGRVDPATAPRVGKLVGAGRLITGTLGTRPNENIGIGAQVVNTVTSAARPALSQNTSMNQILRAQKDLTFRIFTELGVTLTPAERASVEQFQTQNVTALMAYGRGVQYEADGRFGAAAREFRRAAQIDPTFSLASTRASLMQSVSASMPMARALAVTSESVNRPLFGASRVEQTGPADPSFSLSSVIIRLVITSPP